jgi:hypothetical protein
VPEMGKFLWNSERDSRDVDGRKKKEKKRQHYDGKGERKNKTLTLNP